MTGDRTGTTDVLGLIDIGTSKVCCVIVDPNSRGARGEPRQRVIGIGHQRSRGVKGGVVVDLDEAEHSVRAAVAQAERMAGVQLEEVVAGVSCGRMRSSHFSAHADLDSGVVRKDDIQRLKRGARAYAERDGRHMVYLDRLIYRIDNDAGVMEPKGMAGHRLTADVHAITADEAPLRNLKLLIERCYLSLGAAVPSALASVLAVTREEERRLGITCLDIGGGTTSISVFADNRFLLADVIPIGGHHMTIDIARELGTPLPEAERIKALYGALVSAGSDEHEMFSYPLAGEGDSAFHQTTRARLRAILQPRVEGLLALVNERMQRSEIMRYAGERVVLTGGASQLVGIGEFAANALSRPVRIAGPHQASGLPANMSLPAFACVAGLLPAAQMVQGGWASFPEYGVSEHGYFGRMGQWLRQSF